MFLQPTLHAVFALDYIVCCLHVHTLQAIERVEQLHGSALLRAYKMPRLKYKGVPGAEQ